MSSSCLQVVGSPKLKHAVRPPSSVRTLETFRRVPCPSSKHHWSCLGPLKHALPAPGALIGRSAGDLAWAHLLRRRGQSSSDAVDALVKDLQALGSAGQDSQWQVSLCTCHVRQCGIASNSD